jgi:hypothetical protein
MRAIKEYKLYIFFLFLLIAFVLVTDFNGLYGQDSYEYLRYTKCLEGFIKTGVSPGDYFWPLLYPIAGAILSFIFSSAFALQLISVASLILIAIYLEKIIVLLYSAYKQKVRLFIFLFLLLSPYVLRGSLVVMSDSLSIFCITAAWFYGLKYRSSLSGKHFLAIVLFAAAAIETRYAAFIILLIPTLIVGYVFLRNFKITNLLFALGIAVLIFLPHFLIRSKAPLAFIHHEWVESWSCSNFFRNQFITSDGNAQYPLWNIVFSFFNMLHPAFIFAGIVFIIAGIKSIFSYLKSPPYLMIAATVLLYAFFLAGIPFQNMRFLLLSFPLVLVLVYPGFISIEKRIASKKRVSEIATVLIAIMQFGLFYRVFMPFYHDNKVEKQIANEMLKYSNATLYTFSIDGALKAYGYNGRIINMWDVKLDTVKNDNGPSMVLFNEHAFAEQWKDKNPMLNWEFLKTKYKLAVIDSLPDNWVLYKVE